MVVYVDGLLVRRVVYDLTDVERIHRPFPVGRDPAHVAHGSGAIRETIPGVNRVVDETGDAALVPVDAYTISTPQDVLVSY